MRDIEYHEELDKGMDSETSRACLAAEERTGLCDHFRQSASGRT